METLLTQLLHEEEKNRLAYLVNLLQNDVGEKKDAYLSKGKGDSSSVPFVSFLHSEKKRISDNQENLLSIEEILRKISDKNENKIENDFEGGQNENLYIQKQKVTLKELQKQANNVLEKKITDYVSEEDKSGQDSSEIGSSILMKSCLKNIVEIVHERLNYLSNNEVKDAEENINRGQDSQAQGFVDDTLATSGDSIPLKSPESNLLASENEKIKETHVNTIKKNLRDSEEIMSHFTNLESSYQIPPKKEGDERSNKPQLHYSDMYGTIISLVTILPKLKDLYIAFFQLRTDVTTDKPTSNSNSEKRVMIPKSYEGLFNEYLFLLQKYGEFCLSMKTKLIEKGSILLSSVQYPHQDCSIRIPKENKGRGSSGSVNLSSPFLELSMIVCNLCIVQLCYNLMLDCTYTPLTAKAYKDLNDLSCNYPEVDYSSLSNDYILPLIDQPPLNHSNLQGHTEDDLDEIRARKHLSLRQCYDAINPWLLAILLPPLHERFKYHFCGDKATNNYDRPDWFFDDTRKMLNNVELIVTGSGIQGIYTHIFLPYINWKMRHILKFYDSNLDYDISFFDINEAMGFYKSFYKLYWDENRLLNPIDSDFPSSKYDQQKHQKSDINDREDEECQFQDHYKWNINLEMTKGKNWLMRMIATAMTRVLQEQVTERIEYILTNLVDNSDSSSDMTSRKISKGAKFFGGILTNFTNLLDEESEINDENSKRKEEKKVKRRISLSYQVAVLLCKLADECMRFDSYLKIKIYCNQYPSVSNNTYIQSNFIHNDSKGGKTSSSDKAVQEYKPNIQNYSLEDLRHLFLLLNVDNNPYAYVKPFTNMKNEDSNYEEELKEKRNIEKHPYSSNIDSESALQNQPQVFPQRGNTNPNEILNPSYLLTSHYTSNHLRQEEYDNSFSTISSPSTKSTSKVIREKCFYFVRKKGMYFDKNSILAQYIQTLSTDIGQHIFHILWLEEFSIYAFTKNIDYYQQWLASEGHLIYSHLERDVPLRPQASAVNSILSSTKDLFLALYSSYNQLDLQNRLLRPVKLAIDRNKDFPTSPLATKSTLSDHVKNTCLLKSMTKYIFESPGETGRIGADVQYKIPFSALFQDLQWLQLYNAKDSTPLSLKDIARSNQEKSRSELMVYLWFSQNTFSYKQNQTSSLFPLPTKIAQCIVSLQTSLMERYGGSKYFKKSKGSDNFKEAENREENKSGAIFDPRVYQDIIEFLYFPFLKEIRHNLVETIKELDLEGAFNNNNLAEYFRKWQLYVNVIATIDFLALYLLKVSLIQLKMVPIQKYLSWYNNEKDLKKQARRYDFNVKQGEELLFPMETLESLASESESLSPRIEEVYIRMVQKRRTYLLQEEEKLGVDDLIQDIRDENLISGRIFNSNPKSSKQPERTFENASSQSRAGNKEVQSTEQDINEIEENSTFDEGNVMIGPSRVIKTLGNLVTSHLKSQKRTKETQSLEKKDDEKGDDESDDEWSWAESEADDKSLENIDENYKDAIKTSATSSENKIFQTEKDNLINDISGSVFDGYNTLSLHKLTKEKRSREVDDERKENKPLELSISIFAKYIHQFNLFSSAMIFDAIKYIKKQLDIRLRSYRKQLNNILASVPSDASSEESSNTPVLTTSFSCSTSLVPTCIFLRNIIGVAISTLGPASPHILLLEYDLISYIYEYWLIEAFHALDKFSTDYSTFLQNQKRLSNQHNKREPNKDPSSPKKKGEDRMLSPTGYGACTWKLDLFYLLQSIFQCENKNDMIWGHKDKSGKYDDELPPFCLRFRSVFPSAVNFANDKKVKKQLPPLSALFVSALIRIYDMPMASLVSLAHLMEGLDLAQGREIYLHTGEEPQSDLEAKVQAYRHLITDALKDFKLHASREAKKVQEDLRRQGGSSPPSGKNVWDRTKKLTAEEEQLHSALQIHGLNLYPYFAFELRSNRSNCKIDNPSKSKANQAANTQWLLPISLPLLRLGLFQGIHTLY